MNATIIPKIKNLENKHIELLNSTCKISAEVHTISAEMDYLKIDVLEHVRRIDSLDKNISKLYKLIIASNIIFVIYMILSFLIKIKL